MFFCCAPLIWATARSVTIWRIAHPAETEGKLLSNDKSSSDWVQIAGNSLRRGCIRTGDNMILKPLMAAMAVAIGISATTAMVTTPAHAQNNVEAEMLGFHQLCDKGDRKACVRFGILLGKNEQRHADWRRGHAEWFWWER
jgi:hypothetical protein